MNNNLSKFYNENFYSNHIDGMSISAAIVLGLLYEHYKPQTVIDIGCGQGAWLAAAESLGAKTLKGMDGEWVRKEQLLSKNIDFTAVDFDRAIPKSNERYDLCISLEVAEHISEVNAKKFINLLCETSDIVLFSAAIKYQGGTNHVNEQWQSYWIDLFKSNGYECLDLFRKTLWNNNSVEWWYRQNILFFSGPKNSFLDLEALRSIARPVLDIVHPINYEKKVNFIRNQTINYEKKVNSLKYQIECPTLRFCLGCIKRYIKNKLRRLR